MPRPSRRSRTFRTAAERLERRDCPAAITITGSRDLGEAAGFTDLTVRLSAADRAPVSVDYFLSGDAAYGRDYQLAIGTSRLTGPTGTITFRPGETTKTIRMTIVNDIDREATERMGITLFRPRNATLGGTTSAAVTIADDDSYTARIMPLGSSTLAEGTAGTFELRLSSPATRTESFYVSTKSAEAQSGTDFRPLTKLPLIFRPGESAKRFTVQTVMNADASEYSEVFLVAAESTTTGFPRIDDLAVTIAGRGPVPQPGISIGDASVAEGAPGVVTPLDFRITLSHAFRLPVTVTYATADGSATTADSDYRATSGRVTIPAGETSATVTVPVVGDDRLEPNETFSIVLSAPVNGTLADAVGVGTILNDDSGFQVTLRFIDSPNGTVPQSVRTVADQAAKRWARIITGDLPDVLVGGVVIDDFEMSIQMGLLDGEQQGPGGTLANAMPTAFRDNGAGIPYAGITGLDPADIGNPSQLLDTITHEMGHAFGFIGWANVFGRWIVSSSFTGANALREYRSLFATTATAVPMQPGGGHWDETIFGNELMSPTTFGGPEYISRITIGALQDMGYTVDYNAAEPYVRPRILSARVGATTVAPLARGTMTAVSTTGRTGNRMLLFAALDPALSMYHAFAEHGRDSTTSRGGSRRLTPVIERLADVRAS
jgi:hypothetical protein